MSGLMSRRQFLIAGASIAGGAAVMGGLPELLASLNASAPGFDVRLVASAQEKIIPSVCLLCPGGCGIHARVVDGRVVKLEGNPLHPISNGALCPKGQAALELLYNPDRLVGPLRRTGERGAGQWEPITWNEAVRLVAEKLQAVRAASHPERAAILYGETRGQMRPFIERFMQAVGSPNAVSHDSLNIEAARLAMYLTQGIYDLPAYDLENTNYVLSFGASLLEAGRVPQRTIGGYAFMRRGRAKRGKVVMIDPRQGITGAKADEWIPIKPGTDVALALGIANVIVSTGQFDSDFVHNYAFGFEDSVDSERRFQPGFKSFVLENYSPETVEGITGIPAATIYRLAGEFANNPPAIAVLPGKGGLLNGSVNGLYAAMAVHMLNALVGSIEKPGGVLVQRYMPSPEWPPLPEDLVAQQGRLAERVDGAGTRFPVALHAYQAVADRILDGYPVDVLLLYGANPVFEVPGGSRFVNAFERVPFVVSFSTFLDETAQYADLVLPEPTFLERFQDDHIEGVGYPGLGLRQPVISPRFDTLPTGDFLLQVAAKIGGPVAEAFPWATFEELLRDRLRLVGADWDTLRELGVWLTPGYRFARRGSQSWLDEVVGVDRRNAPRDGRFDFYSREMRALLGQRSRDELARLGISAAGDTVFVPHYEPVAYAGDEAEYPFLLNVITLMSLGPYSANANLPTLQEISGMTVGETWGSWLEMNPEAVERLHLEDGEAVVVESRFGRLETKLKLVNALRPDVVNLPYNQGHSAVGRWAKNRGVNGLEILNPTSEPVTGLAAFTNTRVRVYRADAPTES
jgi:menaquinone reductase, molybdopterin-binding-like subunit